MLYSSNNQTEALIRGMMSFGICKLTIFEELVRLAHREVPPSELLASAANAIAAEVLADCCRIYLARDLSKLVLRVSVGSTCEAGEALEMLALGAVSHARLAGIDSPESSSLAVPLMSRARCLGAIVVARGEDAGSFTELELGTLSAVASQMVALVEGAQLIDVIDGTAGPRQAEPDSHERTPGELVLVGTAASPGIAIGTAAFRHIFPQQFGAHAPRASGDRAEPDRLRDALQKTQNDLLRIQAAAAGELGEEQALIFGAHLLILHDSMLLSSIDRGLKLGLSAAESVDKAFSRIVKRLNNVSDPYIQERIEDVEDLRSRVLGHLLEEDVPASLRAQIVVSPRTSPSVIMELKAQGALGVASELGGTTSHGVLLARALGVPAVTGVDGLLRMLASGDALIVDGEAGRVILRPTRETILEYRERESAALQKRAEFSKYRTQAPQTADHVQFELRANVALGVELEVARENGASGVGLYRTEFAFIAREGLPSRDEQVRIYAKAYQAFPEGPISFRILDLAGDKLVPGSGARAAQGAFHGYRSIRVLFDYPHILRTQAQAFSLAAGNRPLRILIPMVSSLEEAVRIKQLVHSALSELPQSSTRPPPIFGAMIEVPAAVEIVADLAREVEFFSIGTNDLVQYALVIDREDSRMSSPRDVFQPAVLRMIRRVVKAAQRAGKEVSVCGEAAARPEFAIALLALDVRTLSVSPRAIPELKQKLANVTLQPLISDVEQLLESTCATVIEQTLRRML
ncbi:MAG TPA: phosphoenolpyruvate--protein phosphotransferase [Polyangiaceae bacterium]|nr:phosphoenolpyruvate--protein phosphotransferase [Polyangiaceae bacterium]